MNKKFLAILLAGILFTGCGSNSSSQSKPAETTTNDNRTSAVADDDSSSTTTVDNRENTENIAPKSDDIDGSFKKSGYLYENSIGDSLYFYVIENQSDKTVSIDGNATAYNASNNAVGASTRSIDVLGPGEKSILPFYFDSVTGIDRVDCTLSYDEHPYYKPVINNISMNQTINNRNITITATNKGNINAQFVEAYALFLDKDNKVINYKSTYITDNDSEIKPGATITVQLDTYDDFDHVEVYLTGRSDGSASEVTSDINDSDFDVSIYGYENSIGSSSYYAIVTNNSDKTVGIDINMIAYDSSNNTIGADDGDISVLGPGETSIASFYFGSVAGINHVEYSMQCDPDPYYESGLKDLEAVYNVNNKNVVVTVTNHGTKPTQFLQAYALFFDAAGNLVDSDYTYITDSDSELKPGATLSEQLDTYGDFNDVSVYLSGRR